MERLLFFVYRLTGMNGSGIRVIPGDPDPMSPGGPILPHPQNSWGKKRQSLKKQKEFREHRI